MECHRLCIQRIVVNARRSLVAAAMRRRHLHLAALAFHHPAARTFLSAHLRIGDHAGHRGCQA
jgi:hypothetical protein